MRYLLDPVQTSNVVKGVNTRAQPSVQAKDLVVNQSGEREVVEEIGKVLPYVRVAVLAQALVIEAVNLGDLAGFMVAPEDGDAGRVANFESDEESDSFDGVIATVNVIPLISGCQWQKGQCDRLGLPMKR